MNNLSTFVLQATSLFYTPYGERRTGKRSAPQLTKKTKQGRAKSKAAKTARRKNRKQ